MRGRSRFLLRPELRELEWSASTIPAPPAQPRVDLRSGFLFESLPHWKEILRLSIDERCEALQQADVRHNLKADFADDTTMGHLTAHLRKMWPMLTVTTVSDKANEKYLGRTVGSIAAQEGSDPMDTMLDLAVRDHLDTIFMNDNVTPSGSAANEAMQELTHHEDVVFGGSDAGAHLDFMSNEPLPSRALALRVREQGVLSSKRSSTASQGAWPTCSDSKGGVSSPQGWQPTSASSTSTRSAPESPTW